MDHYMTGDADSAGLPSLPVSCFSSPTPREESLADRGRSPGPPFSLAYNKELGYSGLSVIICHWDCLVSPGLLGSQAGPR